MVPRKYIFEDADAMSDYLDDSYFNGKLLNAVLTTTNNLSYPSLNMEMLDLFNEAYYNATRVLFEQYPEIDIRRSYLDHVRACVGDDYTRDVVFAMVYVILNRLENRPEKAERFCSQLEIIYSFGKGYLDDIINAKRVCEYQRIYSDWDWTPPAVDLYEVFGTPTDWKEATDDFKLENIKSYMEHCITVDASYEVLSDIQKALHAEKKKDKDAYSANLLTKVAMMLSEIKREKDVSDSIKKVKAMQTEPDPPLTLTTEFHAQDYVEGEEPEPEEDKDAEIARLNGIIEEKDKEIAKAKESYAELEGINKDAMKLLGEMKEKFLKEAEIDPDDVAGERTLAITTITLVKILKAAGMGKDAGGYDDTNVAKLINYFTKFSPNTLRKQVPKTKIPKTALKEVKKVNELLKAVNLDISIK